MLSSRLIQLIEKHSDAITARIMREIRQDPRLRHIASLPADELQSRARDLVENLGRWLTSCREEGIVDLFEAVGKQRYGEVPLHELVLVYQLIKERMVEFVRNQGLGQSTLELYAEEELERRVSRFFDIVVYHIVYGYEAAARAAGDRVAAAY